MPENSKIEWCKHTWSPWRGCTKVSEGCKFCYADATAKRNPGTLGVWGPNGKRVVNADWKVPLKWNRQAAKAGERWRIFPSMCDPFEDFAGQMFDSHGRELWYCRNCETVDAFDTKDITPNDGVMNCTGPEGDQPGCYMQPLKLADVRTRFFQLIDATPNLDWLVLTKRPENIRDMMPTVDDGFGGDLAAEIFGKPGKLVYKRPNLWLGTSVEKADFYCRIEELRKVPAAIRFLSLEPLLGPMPDLPLDGIDWGIVGGESGPNARPCNVAWIRDIVRQCRDADGPVFVKQLGSNPVRYGSPFRAPHNGHEGIQVVQLRDPKGGDASEWPEDLRVRESPRKMALSA